ncbi:hypothetical protein CR203_18305 [Salipaludibacillus neizhouensis]|uniref:MarR family transcriptional regulator n=1 Tax=Salipaludibacillus neizhouensis TaxID=885475 RepID=A0A3A9JY51_9BACI|nr:hypothetical protein [Salipaludibacillus neizhouensis]RKL65814.1 hypothetical protein CR203_18305 [Salipaludibacillus neizhouensis]
MTDIERKVYRIVWNINLTQQRYTKYNELLRKTGRDEKGLNLVLQSLVEQEIIWWDKKKTRDVALRKERVL